MRYFTRSGRRPGTLGRMLAVTAATALAAPLAFAGSPAHATTGPAQQPATAETGDDEAATNETENKVLVIGIDGAGRLDRLNAAQTPQIDALREDGTWATSLLYSDNSGTTQDWSQRGSATMSGAGWSSILTGVWPDKHHVVDNTFEGKQYEKYPSFIDRIESIAPEVNTFASTTWTPLTSDVAAGGTILNADEQYATGDDDRTEETVLQALTEGDPDVLFTAFDDVDHVGHTTGPMTEEFIAAIEEVDARIGRILDAVEERPTREQEDWTIILTADHGHRDEGGHGGGTVAERSTFVIAAGDTVADAGRTHNLAITDIAATVFDRLGVQTQESWGLDGFPIGSIPSSDFDTLRPELQAAQDETGIGENVRGWTHTPPPGWNVDNAAMPDGGVTEWRGWTFTTQPFWSATDRNQGRENALRMRDVFAVADSDEWDDATNAGSTTTPFDSTLTSPAYAVGDRAEVSFTFQSSYFQEGDQKGEIAVSFDGGEHQVLKTLTESQNGPLTVTSQVPEGAKNARIHFRYTGNNNWFWALDALTSDAPRAEDGGTPTAETTYVDCTAEAAEADGTKEHPLTSLDAVNELGLDAGDQVLFHRGSTCTGTLVPNGSGKAGQPVVIGAYGTGEAPLLDGAGAHDVILLENVEHITVQDLAVTNAANPGTERNGVRIHLKDFGKASGITVQRLHIYDVLGNDKKGLYGSAGILVGIDGETRKTWFDHLTIAENTIDHVGREGIYFKSTWSVREEVGNQDYTGLGPWTPSTNVVVSGNTLTDIAGDGIKIDTTQGAVVEHNILHGFQLRSAANNAGIWTFNADDTIIQYNEVSGGGSDRDGMSFDSDGGSQGTVIQYNYSHDNAGGFLLLCPYSGAWTHGTVVRYNISRNDDARLFQLCPGDIDDTHIYNNTFINTTTSPTYFLQDDNSKVRGVTWRNNIVLNRGPAMQVEVGGPGLTFQDNLLVGVEGVPENADGQTNPGGLSTDPGLVDETHEPTGIDDLQGAQLRAGSPALQAGQAVPNNGGQDFFGNPVPAEGPVNMGAYQGPGVEGLSAAVLRMEEPVLVAGAPGMVEASLTWWSRLPSAPAKVDLEVPRGWQVEPVDAEVPNHLQVGESVQLRWKVTPPKDADGDASLTVTATGRGAELDTVSSTAPLSALVPDLQTAFNDVAITSDGADPYTGDLALSHSSLSAQELKRAKGIAPGASVAGEHVTYTWPQFTPGTENAVWATGQSIALQGQGSHLGFVLFSVNGYPTPVQGTASVTYTDGTRTTFELAAGDYYYNQPAPGTTVFTEMDYRNTPDGKDAGPFSLYESTIELDETKEVSYVTLPDLPAYSDGKTPGMLVLAMQIGG